MGRPKPRWLMALFLHKIEGFYRVIFFAIYIFPLNPSCIMKIFRYSFEMFSIYSCSMCACVLWLYITHYVYERAYCVTLFSFFDFGMHVICLAIHFMAARFFLMLLLCMHVCHIRVDWTCWVAKANVPLLFWVCAESQMCEFSTFNFNHRQALPIEWKFCQ